MKDLAPDAVTEADPGADPGAATDSASPTAPAPRPAETALEGALGHPFQPGNAIDPLRNGVEIFPAMLAAIDPQEDMRGPAEFKKHVAGVVLRRAIAKAQERAQ